jgi:hypothetical protein
VGFHRRAAAHKTLALTRRAPLASVVVDLSLRPSHVAAPDDVIVAARPSLATVRSVRPCSLCSPHNERKKHGRTEAMDAHVREE